MKTLAWLLIVFGPLSVATADDKKDQPKAQEGLKCVVDQFDKAWGIKFKSMKIVPGKEGYGITITLEFTKDVPDVKQMQRAFAPGDPKNLDNHPIVFWLFDEDNVSIGWYAIKATEGVLTGVKGDAFRIILALEPEKLPKGKKLEARLANPPPPTKESIKDRR